MDIMQKHDVKPIEEVPAQPMSEPQSDADGDSIKEVICEAIGA